MGSQEEIAEKIIAVGQNERFNSVHWPPDGNRLAYVRVRDTPKGLVGFIETSGVNGGNQTVAVTDESSLPIQDFCWLPNRQMIYSRQESGSSEDTNLWLIGIDGNTGKPIGERRRITQWAGSQLTGLSASADGKRLVLRKQSAQGRGYLAELTTGGARMSTPRPLTNGDSDDNPTT